jgi:hypothetical protein
MFSKRAPTKTRPPRRATPKVNATRAPQEGLAELGYAIGPDSLEMPRSAGASTLLRLQEVFGNQFVQRLVADARSVLRKWTDADSATYPAPKDPKQLPTPTGGWNAANQTIDGVERIPLEGLKAGLQASDKRSPGEIADETPKLRQTEEAENGKAIVLVPAGLKPGQPIEILLHLHGHNVGYRQRSKKSEDMEAGSVRDVATDRIEQQLGASTRNMIGILPQGTTGSGFGAFDADAYINEVWGILVGLKKLPKDPTRGAVVLSGHSGAASPIVTMLKKHTVPTGLGELVLFDAIHAGQRSAVQDFLQEKMDADVKKLRDLAKTGGDAATVAANQADHLAKGFRFRGIFTPKYHPQKKDADGKLMWVDPTAKKKIPVLDESAWAGYGVEYEPLREFIKNWITTNTKGLDASLVKTLRDNYKVVEAGAGATHNKIMGVHDNLKGALSVLPVAPATKSPTSAPVQPLRAVQRQPTAPAAPLTDEQQWEQDWTSHPGQHGYFAGSGRPPGTDHERYLKLAPLYKAHGIPRPILYMASSITTATFYTFSTPAHNDLAKKLKDAETALKAKGHATAPVVSVWALNARTTSAGGWSNHADGKAVDIDPDSNPHLIDKKQRKVISLVTGSDIEAASPGYDALKGASNKFKADYNAAGLARRITELQAVESTKKTELDTAKSELDTLNGQRDALKAERGTKAKELRAVPTGKKATPDDVAKATELKTRLTQIDTNLGSLKTEIKTKTAEIKTRTKALKDATDDRVLLENQLKSYEATDKAIADLQASVKSLPDDIKTLDDRINQTRIDEQDALKAKNPKGAKAQQTLRGTLQQTQKTKKAELKKKEAQLKVKEKQRDDDPLRGYAAGGFLNLPKDVVEAMTGAGLKWGGNWAGAKDFMHFEL